MTERLYYDDAYTSHFTAAVRERLTLEGRPAVVLNQSHFYPTGGGQPNDTGTLNDIPVVDVHTREDDAAVIHVLAQPLEGDTVTGVIDWARRFDHMQHHTGQHILTQAFVQTADAKTVGFHLSPDSVTIDLDTAALTTQQIDAAEDLANQVVWENRPVKAYLKEDGKGVRMRRLPKHLLTDGLRVIDIDGFDVTACGGTHIAHTGEIGMIKVVKVERRGTKTRVEFRCGTRALRDFRDKTRVSQPLMAALNCGLTDLPDAVTRLQNEYKAAQSALKIAAGQLLDYEAAWLLAETPPAGGVKIVTAAYENRDPGEVKLLAGKVAAAPDTIALFGTAGEKSMLFFARSASLPHDMGRLLKDTLGQIGGRGGGQPDFAQGGGIPLDKTALEAVLAGARAALEASP